jgi:site-specific DNA-methyltransferase (adenine-specific)
MVQWRLYITPDGDKGYMLPKDSTKDMNMIDHTCVLTGQKFKSRGKFWKYIEDSKLDPDTMTYDKKATCENTELMDKSHLEWLWTHYFKEKGNKKKLENLLGSINLELYIILLKVYKGEMDIDECLEDMVKECNVKESVNEEIVEEESIEGENELEDDNQIYEFTDDILNEDCIVGMKKIPDDSIDIIISDPPYNIGKDFGNDSDKQEMDTYLKWCDQWIEQCIRILKPDGTLFIYGFSEILSFIRVRISINVRWIVWHYTNKVTPSLNFWQRTHESILCCYKDKPHFNRDEVREPYTEGYLKNSAGKVRKGTKGRFGEKETVYTAHKNGALPRDVIKISALAGGAGKKERVDHPTQKPLELCEKLIKSSMKKPDETFMVVPFAGSGSECVAAKKLGVNFVGFEINPLYVELCKSRLN